MANNFEMYGFKSNFDGEILKSYYDAYKRKIMYLGYYISNTRSFVAATWDKEGYCHQGIDVEYYNLTPIENHNNDCRNCAFFRKTAHAQPQGNCINEYRFKDGNVDTHVFYNSNKGCNYWKHR